MSFVRRLSEVAWLAVALVAVAVAAFGLWAWTNVLHDWMPNVGTEALSIAATVAIVGRIVARRRAAEESERVIQALRRISGDLHVLADFTLWDYVDMHTGDRYQRPPNDLRGLLAHWKVGLATREVPWPKDPRILSASKSISNRLDEQITRHERVLDNPFVAAAYDYMRGELISRNMYLDEREHYDDDGWKTTSLGGIADEVLRLLDVFEPYARSYLGRDWGVKLSDDSVDYAERVYRRPGA
jgi:hypothetical protein